MVRAVASGMGAAGVICIESVPAMNLCSARCRPSTAVGINPVEDHLYGESQVAYLAVVLSLFSPGEYACSHRSGVRQGLDLLPELAERDVVIFGAGHE